MIRDFGSFLLKRFPIFDESSVRYLTRTCSWRCENNSVILSFLKHLLYTTIAFNIPASWIYFSSCKVPVHKKFNNVGPGYSESTQLSKDNTDYIVIVCWVLPTSFLRFLKQWKVGNISYDIHPNEWRVTLPIAICQKSKAATVVWQKYSILIPQSSTTDVCAMSRRSSSSKMPSVGDQSPVRLRNVSKSSTYNTLMDKATLAKNVSY